MKKGEEILAISQKLTELKLREKNGNLGFSQS